MNTRTTASFFNVQIDDSPVSPEMVARLRAALQCELAHVARRAPEPAKPGLKPSQMHGFRSERSRLNRRTRVKLRRAARHGICVNQLNMGPLLA